MKFFKDFVEIFSSNSNMITFPKFIEDIAPIFSKILLIVNPIGQGRSA